jgi:hypothetical protein
MSFNPEYFYCQLEFFSLIANSQKNERIKANLFAKVDKMRRAVVSIFRGNYLLKAKRDRNQCRNNFTLYQKRKKRFKFRNKALGYFQIFDGR